MKYHWPTFIRYLESNTNMDLSKEKKIRIFCSYNIFVVIRTKLFPVLFRRCLIIDNHCPITHRLHLGLSHLEHVLTQMFDAFHGGALNFGVQRSRGGEHLARGKHQLVWALQETIEGRLELVARFEDLAATEDVQAQSSAGQCDGETADVA